MSKDLVLVTGASGYIAGYCIGELLEHGYAVRATVRSLAAADRVAHLRALAEQSKGTLEFVEAELDSDRGWPEAVAGRTYVLHVASPNPLAAPKHEDELIRPAVDGTLRVLRACADSGTVRRVVLTSSMVAVTLGPDRNSDRVLTEDDWSDPDLCPAYPKSKTLAERAAWDFVAALPAEQRFELATINPGYVLGPQQRAELGLSAEGPSVNWAGPCARPRRPLWTQGEAWSSSAFSAGRSVNLAALCSARRIQQRSFMAYDHQHRLWTRSTS
ncbi:MAG: hypothetical protein QOE61_399 [Micromonosporaceae bacterium]|jgi:nucleoside-diphosphate-sugar epimerase|nr:hypothetical protein [Micromonosporaceae bacterium]